LSDPAEPLGVAVVGWGWMGAVHARAWSRLGHHYPDLAGVVRLVSVADPVAERRHDAVRRFGFAAAYDGWRDAVADPAVHLVSVTAPNAVHREIGCAVAAAGKHLWIEKPVGLDASDARAVADAVREAGVASAVGFNYRNAPAVERARELVRARVLGEVTHARVQLFSDYAAHPEGALTWRFERATGGAGVLGDLAAHGVDLVRFLLGDVERLVADTAVFVPSRPRPVGARDHFARGGGEPGAVENEDFVSALLRTRSGPRVTLEASRVAVGEQNSYSFSVHGSRGSLAWDFRRMGELQVAVNDGVADYQDVATATVLVGPGHGELGAFQPGAGIAMGYDDLKVIEAARFLRAALGGEPTGATVHDAVQGAVVLDAMSESARTGAWVAVDYSGAASR
jgi:predicted dehydrogenase